jgi:hypothetical protein
VPVADAADATGVIVTVNQLALVVGVATFGTLYLNLAGRLPSHGAAGDFRQLSAHAVSVTLAVLAGGAVAGGLLAAIRAARIRRLGSASAGLSLATAVPPGGARGAALAAGWPAPAQENADD